MCVALIHLGYNFDEVKSGRFLVALPAKCISAADHRVRVKALRADTGKLMYYVDALSKNIAPDRVVFRNLDVAITDANRDETVMALWRYTYTVEAELKALKALTVVQDPAAYLACACDKALIHMKELQQTIDKEIEGDNNITLDNVLLNLQQ